MRREHVILVAGAIAVSGIALYLFVAVREAPAQAQVIASTVESPKRSIDADADATDAAPRVARARPDPDARDDEPRGKRPIRALGKPMMGDFRKATAERELAEQDPDRANPKLDAVMDEANKAYDSGDTEDAKAIALKVLASDPTNVRMLRIAVSTSCIDGDSAEAQKHYAQLPGGDREQMRTRCARYGVTFNDTDQKSPNLKALDQKVLDQKAPSKGRLN